MTSRRCARCSLRRHGQADLAAERGEARVTFVAKDEGVEEEIPDVAVAMAPGSIKPFEGLSGIVA